MTMMVSRTTGSLYVADLIVKARHCDNSPYNKADSLHDSSSGFASDVTSYLSNGSSLSTFKGSQTARDSCISPAPQRSTNEKLKPPWSPADATPPQHYNAHDLSIHYRMATPPSPLSYHSTRSSSMTSHGSSYSLSHGSSHKSSVKSSPSSVHQQQHHHHQNHRHPHSESPLPVNGGSKNSPVAINYKNPAYEYQLDKHMEEIQNNIKRIEISDTDQILGAKIKSNYSCMSVFDLLADDIIVRIFSHLSSDQLCRISRVCERWYRLVWDPLLWKHICVNNGRLKVDRALKYLTKRLSYNTPTVCVIVESITLSGCERLTNKGLRTIAKSCPELRHLDLQGCSNISNDALFEVTSYCVNLEHLNVTGCPCVTSISLTEQMLRQACAHHLRQINLRHLDMTDCYALDDEGLRLISLHCSHLQQLYLRRCVRVGDAGIQSLAKYCPEIQELSISDCRRVTDFGICELSKLESNLRYLSVAKCDKISDVGIIQLVKHCCKLRYLNLRGCEAVSDDAMDVLARHCPRLKSLDVGKCDVTDEGLQVLAQNCRQLKKLSVKSCDSITDEGVKVVAKSCRNLQQLNIQDCHLTVEAYKAVKRYCKKCFIEHTNPGFY